MATTNNIHKTNIRLVVPDYTDRQSIAKGLLNSGYKVWFKGKGIKGNKDKDKECYVWFEAEEE